MFHELFILGIAGPTSLVIISIVALIILVLKIATIW